MFDLEHLRVSFHFLSLHVCLQLDVEGDVISFGIESKEEKNEEREESGMKWHRIERSSQFQKRALRLPENANMQDISAKYESGVLTVSIPKMVVKPMEGNKRIPVS